MPVTSGPPDWYTRSVKDKQDWTNAPPAVPLDGSEPFRGMDATVADFWAFAMSDLRMNNVRGYLAEFLVRQAVGATHTRVEWDSADVIAPDGSRIEVKASAYVQSWAQRGPSRITFGGLRGRMWTPQDGLSTDLSYNADVYVFAVQTADSHDSYDPLDVSQWAFWVVPVAKLAQLGFTSISLATVERLADRIGFQDLPALLAVERN